MLKNGVKSKIVGRKSKNYELQITNYEGREMPWKVHKYCEMIFYLFNNE